MRRTDRGRDRFTPDELEALYAQVKAEAAGMHPLAASRHVRATLAAAGTDPLEVLRARLRARSVGV